MGPTYALSLYDLITVTGFAEAYGSEDKDKIEEFLWTHGMDINEDYEEESVYHRPLSSKSNEPVFGVRFIGTERTDKEWIKSGCATLEACIRSSGDLTMINDLKGMSREGNQSRYETDNYDVEHEECFDKKQVRKK